MSSIKLSDGDLQALVAKSIVESLTPEKREALIENAVTALISQKAGSAYNAPTVLQDAFNRAVAEVAQQIAREQIVGNTDIKAKIVVMIAEAWEKLVASESYSAMVEQIETALRKGLVGDRY